MKNRSVPILRSALWLVLAMSISLVQADMEQDRAEGIAWLLTHQNGDGSWGRSGAKVAATAEAISALRNSGADLGFLYSRALSWLANARTDSVDSLSRKIFALNRADINAATLGLVNDLMSLRNEQLGWGAFEGHVSGFPDTALALSALYDFSSDCENLIDGLNLIKTAQASGDSGWSYLAGSQGAGLKQQIMPSAYNLIALVTYQPLTSSSSNIARGVNWLVSSVQQANGSFLEDGSITTGAVHKTALGYIAIKRSVESGAVSGMETALNSAQSYILSQQAADGSWENNALSTALALQTLPERSMPDADGDGIPDAVELLLGTNINAPDGRDLLAGNGQDPDGLQHTGMSADSAILEVLVNQAFSFTPTLYGGASPFEWQMSSGSLPNGVTLQSTANGTLSGTPNTTGSVSFALLVQDTSMKSLVVPGFIRVLDGNDYLTDTDQDGAPSVFEINEGFDPLDANSTPILDRDGDLIVDWLDVFPNDSSEWADSDNDGIGNNADPDNDNDGMPDSFEIRYGLNPYDSSDAAIHSDGDGLTNLEEASYNTNPFLDDTDGDGVDDAMEIAQGSNPNIDDKLIPVLIGIITNYVMG